MKTFVTEHGPLVVRHTVQARREPELPHADKRCVLVTGVRERDELTCDDAGGLARRDELDRVRIADRGVRIRRQEVLSRCRLVADEPDDILVDPPVVDPDSLDDPRAFTAEFVDFRLGEDPMIAVAPEIEALHPA